MLRGERSMHSNPSQSTAALSAPRDSGSSSNLLLSVVILNYNGARWLARCLESLRGQTIFDRIEVWIADNASQDGSDQLAQELLRGWTNGHFVQNGGNFGYCEGNNLGARDASGKYLLFLNNDTWMAPDCLEVLGATLEGLQAGAGSPQILNYQDQELQGYGRSGFDLFGYYSNQEDVDVATELFIAPGCAYCIRRDLFWKLGGFDPEFFMYADETDLSWRVWIAGERVVTVPQAKLYHWGAGASAPASGSEPAVFRTSQFSRFHTNRNALLVLLKNTQHVLWLLVPAQLLSLTAEAVFMCLVTRNFSFVRHAYWNALMDCWRKRAHVKTERRRIAGFRRRGDFWMMRFWKPLKWEKFQEALRMFRQGLPKI
mgnify:CR=1 FL=1